MECFDERRSSLVRRFRDDFTFDLTLRLGDIRRSHGFWLIKTSHVPVGRYPLVEQCNNLFCYPIRIQFDKYIQWHYITTTISTMIKQCKQNSWNRCFRWQRKIWYREIWFKNVFFFQIHIRTWNAVHLQILHQCYGVESSKKRLPGYLTMDCWYRILYTF